MPPLLPAEQSTSSPATAEPPPLPPLPREPCARSELYVGGLANGSHSYEPFACLLPPTNLSSARSAVRGKWLLFIGASPVLSDIYTYSMHGCLSKETGPNCQRR